MLTTDPISYHLNVIPDLYPSIEVNEKRDSVNNKLLYFVGQVNDDHGFSRLQFHYRILNSKQNKAKSKSVEFNRNGLQSSFYHIWNVEELAAAPGDQVEYYFEIYDNDGVNGPKLTRSAVKTYRLLTEKQIDEKLEANSNSIKNKMSEAIKQASQVEREAKKLNQDLLNKKSLDYADKKQLEALLQKQKDLESLVKEIKSENKQDLFEQQ